MSLKVLKSRLILFRKEKALTKLREKWGVPEAKERSFPEISKYFRKTQAIKKNEYTLDNRTWNDLDMDAVFAQIDRTETTPGDNLLYSLLRRPLCDIDELEERNRVIQTFLHAQEVRERCQMALSKLGKERGNYLLEMLLGERPQASRYAFLYSIVLIFIPAFLVLGLLNFGFGWFGLGAAVLGNMVIHFRTKEKMYEHLSSIRYLGRLIRYAARLTKIRHPVLVRYLDEMEKSLSQVSYIAQKTGLLGREGDFVLIEYMNIVFLTEVRAFHSVLKVLDRYEEQLQQIFETVGFLDAMISVASYRAGLKDYAEPEFTGQSPCLKIKEVIHPLIVAPVSNSIDVESKGILITGSNMSGKTTFLKTVGINALLAQTIHTCLAEKYQSCFFYVVSLIGRADNVIEGKSYYLDEVQAMKRIIESLNSEVACLCLLDEIFRGTNSLERSSASAEVLLYLARNNCIVFATTHEYELLEVVGGVFSNYHFSEEIKEAEGISFDYRLLDGPSTAYNAIRLLRHAGYPEEITEGADRRMKKKKENKS